MATYYTRRSRSPIPLRALEVSEDPVARAAGRSFRVSGRDDDQRVSELVTSAARQIFEMHHVKAQRRLPAVFEDIETGLVRMVYKEISLRFARDVPEKRRRAILGRHPFEVRARNPRMRDQYTVVDRDGRCIGEELLDVANDWAALDEVVFAVPNFVSEYRRHALPKIHEDQWHLRNRGLYVGQTTGEDVDARGAWRITMGRASVAVAVLDDGIDVDHPNLRGRIRKNPDPGDERDVIGRDFFVPDDDADHYDPRPKRFQYPYHRMSGNDIHGTPCAGVIAASGRISDVIGIAPKCRILAVKVFHADDIAADARVADAIRYAAQHAEILSCSWGGPYSPDVELAIEDAAAGRSGRGVAVFCASGNAGSTVVDYPAALPDAIAVGASTDRAALAAYSNRGARVSVVAPSSGGVLGITTTDVSVPNRGFNTGNADAGGDDGLHTNDFGGTSSATPLAAGVAALMLSANARLTRDQLREILQQSADRIGPASAYDAEGHSHRFGYGRVNAARAVRAAAAAKKPKKATVRRR